MSKIPAQFNDVYERLSTEVTWLHGRWKVYEQLFQDTEARIEFLNQCAGPFFYFVQETFISDTVICIAKLTEQKNGVLTLKRLQKLLDGNANQGLASSAAQLLDKIQVKRAPFAKWRNKHIAHLDLQAAVSPNSAALPDITVKEVSEILRMIADYLNLIPRHYMDSEVGYSGFFMGAGDADALVALLRAGIRYEELVEAEQIPWNDYQNGKWHDA